MDALLECNFGCQIIKHRFPSAECRQRHLQTRKTYLCSNRLTIKIGFWVIHSIQPNTAPFSIPFGSVLWKAVSGLSERLYQTANT
jgi:hypothetical protein